MCHCPPAYFSVSLGHFHKFGELFPNPQQFLSFLRIPEISLCFHYFSKNPTICQGNDRNTHALQAVLHVPGDGFLRFPHFSVILGQFHLFWWDFSFSGGFRGVLRIPEDFLGFHRSSMISTELPKGQGFIRFSACPGAWGFLPFYNFGSISQIWGTFPKPPTFS